MASLTAVGHTGMVNCVAWQPWTTSNLSPTTPPAYELTLASASDDCTIRIWSRGPVPDQSEPPRAAGRKSGARACVPYSPIFGVISERRVRPGVAMCVASSKSEEYRQRTFFTPEIVSALQPSGSGAVDKREPKQHLNRETMLSETATSSSVSYSLLPLPPSAKFQSPIPHVFSPLFSALPPDIPSKPLLPVSVTKPCSVASLVPFSPPSVGTRTHGLLVTEAKGKHAHVGQMDSTDESTNSLTVGSAGGTPSSSAGA